TSAGNGYWFALRAVDNADWLSASTASSGPYLIDTTSPAITSVVADAGASHTTTLTVSVAVSANDALSGVVEMRYSSNNSTFSNWVPFASPFNYDLSQFGGNANEGTKRVYVQVRDRAGNTSNVASDGIEYL